MINYYLLTKPGIIMGNLITVAAGFALGAQDGFHFSLFFATLIGLTAVIASACVWNNYLDRHVDKKMARTRNRALAQGLVSHRNVILFAITLALLGFSILFFYTNALTTLLAGIGFFVYVIIYTLWKVRTPYATGIGSIAGAMPPLVGYCAASNQFDLGAVLLFTVLVFWQMPHFFSIAIYHFEDYKAALIPVYPIKKGVQKAKIRMTLYIIAFILATLLLTVFHYTGGIYLIIAIAVGSAWLFLSLRGFKTNDNHLWARNMFRLSLIAITALAVTILAT